jgi:hypothetical protein
MNNNHSINCSANVVSQAVFDQVKWERDTALATLEEHGIGFAQKTDVVEVVHGEWLTVEYNDGSVFKECSNCGVRKQQRYYNFCSNCGADMKRIEKRSTNV